MTKSLEELIEGLIDDLGKQAEPESDSWFSRPMGYLRKPNYNRSVQKRNLPKSKLSIFFALLTKTLLSARYQTRWFVLDSKNKRLIYYKNNKPKSPENGKIDLSQILEVRLSTIFDAPPNSLDLLSKDMIYTITADSQANMIRWALVITLTLPNPLHPPNFVLPKFRTSPFSSHKLFSNACDSADPNAQLTDLNSQPNSPTTSRYGPVTQQTVHFSASPIPTNMQPSRISPPRNRDPRNTMTINGTTPQQPQFQQGLQNDSNLRSRPSLAHVTSGKDNSSNYLQQNSPHAAADRSRSRETFAIPKPKPKPIEFSVIFDKPGPLGFNVMGTVDRDKDGNSSNHQIVVASFESNPNGTPGQAQQSGQISIRDVIIGVNDASIKNMNFADGMKMLKEASWPKKLTFLRDIATIKDTPRIESWGVVYYSALNQRRRRYIELKNNILSFRKPVIASSSSQKRDAYFFIDHIAQFRPMVDKTVPMDQQFTLQLLCKSNATIKFVDEFDNIVGETKVDVIELCFGKQVYLKAWYNSLATKDTEDLIPLDIDSIETIEEQHPSPTIAFDSAPHPITSIPLSNLAILNDITGIFSLREFILQDGYLKWCRPGQSETFQRSNKITKNRSLFLANATTCAIREIRMEEYVSRGKSSVDFPFRLTIITEEAKATLGMKDEKTIRRWFNFLAEVITISPLSLRQKVILPLSIQKVNDTQHRDSNISDPDDSLYARPFGLGASNPNLQLSIISNNDEDTKNGMQGYLYIKIGSATNIDSEYLLNYRKKYFLLKNFKLMYFRSAAEAASSASNPKLAQGVIDMESTIEVKESTNTSHPECSLEIITTNDSYVLVAENEEYQILWLDALADEIENRKLIVMKIVNNLLEEAPLSHKDAVLATVLKSGMIQKKVVNPLNNVAVMITRYGVLTKEFFSYYHNREEFLEQDTTAILEIPISNILNVETDKDPEYENKAFSLTVFARKGRKSMTICAINEAACIEWMEAICAVTGTIELVPSKGGAYHSVKSPVAAKQREDARLQNSILRLEDLGHIKKAAGVNFKSFEEFVEDTDEFLTEEDRNLRSMIALDRRANASTMVIAGRGSGKKQSIVLMRDSLLTRGTVSERKSDGAIESMAQRARTSQLGLGGGIGHDNMRYSSATAAGMYRRRSRSTGGAGRGNWDAFRGTVSSKAAASMSEKSYLSPVESRGESWDVDDTQAADPINTISAPT